MSIQTETEYLVRFNRSPNGTISTVVRGVQAHLASTSQYVPKNGEFWLVSVLDLNSAANTCTVLPLRRAQVTEFYVDTPTWDQGRRPIGILIPPNGEVHHFTGFTIPGVATLLETTNMSGDTGLFIRRKYASLTGTVYIEPDPHNPFPVFSWEELLAQVREKARQVKRESLIEFVRFHYMKVAERLDANATKLALIERLKKAPLSEQVTLVSPMLPESNVSTEGNEVILKIGPKKIRLKIESVVIE